MKLTEQSAIATVRAAWIGGISTVFAGIVAAGAFALVFSNGPATWEVAAGANRACNDVCGRSGKSPVEIGTTSHGSLFVCRTTTNYHGIVPAAGTNGPYGLDGSVEGNYQFCSTIATSGSGQKDSFECLCDS